MRIKFIYGSTASEYAALLCLVVSGLSKNKLAMTDEELKNLKGIYMIEIEGFLIHLNTDSLNKSHSFIIFIRSSKDELYSVDRSRCNYYNDEIFYSFFSSIQNLDILNRMKVACPRLK